MSITHPHARLQVLDPHRENQDENLARLMIEGRNVSFFIKPLTDQCDFRSSADGSKWWLTFFDKSPFRRQVLVQFDVQDNSKRYDDTVTAHWLDNEENPDTHPVLLPQASQLSRRSYTLGSDQLQSLTSTRALVADRRQLVYFSSSHSQFLRTVLCQALAHAYTDVLHTCMNEMVSLLREHDDVSKVLALYENILRFDAISYFRLPVMLARHETSEAWEIIARHYQLNTLHEELTQQVSAAAQLLRTQHEAAQLMQEKERSRLEHEAQQRVEQTDRRRSFWLTVIGLLLTAASLATVFQSSPQQWKANLIEWGVMSE